MAQHTSESDTTTLFLAYTSLSRLSINFSGIHNTPGVFYKEYFVSLIAENCGIFCTPFTKVIEAKDVVCQ